MGGDRKEGDSVSRRIQRLMARARAGAAADAFQLGECYRLGDGVKADLAAAWEWYRLGAELGNARAQNNYGTMLLDGLGGKADAVAAAGWYRAAALQGEPVAQFNFALRCLHGRGVPEDAAEAAHWLALSAEQGYAEAIGELGTLYRFGRGVPKDLLQAADLHVAAAREGDACAHGNLCDCEEELATLALAGSRRAAFALSEMANHGLGREASQAETWAWVRCALDRCPPSGERERDETVIDAYRFYLNYMEPAARCAGDAWLLQRMMGSSAPASECWNTLLKGGMALGSVTVTGYWGTEGWRFKVETWDGTPKLLHEPAISRELGSPRSWRAVLKLLQPSHWWCFSPREVHPEFAERVWRYVKARGEEPPRGKASIDEWQRVCFPAESEGAAS